MNVIWAICEESAWVLPAHQRVLTDMTFHVIDLGSAMTGLELPRPTPWSALSSILWWENASATSATSGSSSPT